MAAKKKPQQITKTRILKALKTSKATSLAALYRAMSSAKGNIPGSTAKRIRELVPDISKRMEANKRATPKPPRRTPGAKSKSKFPIPSCCPYRTSSAYAKVFVVLYFFRKSGIPRRELVKHAAEQTGKTLAKASFDVSVVTSPRKDGTSHRSAATAANTYYCERENEWIRLRMR